MTFTIFWSTCWTQLCPSEKMTDGFVSSLIKESLIDEYHLFDSYYVIPCDTFGVKMVSQIHKNIHFMQKTKIDKNNKSPLLSGLYVDLLGLEPRLFWTKIRRVASYTISQTSIQYFRTSGKDNMKIWKKAKSPLPIVIGISRQSSVRTYSFNKASINSSKSFW